MPSWTVPAAAAGRSDMDLQLIKTASLLCRATYAYPGDVPTSWDYWDAGADDGVVWGIKKVGGVWYAAMRGSVKAASSLAYSYPGAEPG